MRNHRSKAVILRYHLLANSFIWTSLFVLISFFGDQVDNFIGFAIVEQMNPSWKEFLVFGSFIGGYWVAWWLLSREKIGLGIILGLLTSAYPCYLGFISLFSVVMALSETGSLFTELSGLGGLLGVSFVLILLLLGPFIHFLVLLFAQWNGALRTT